MKAVLILPVILNWLLVITSAFWTFRLKKQREYLKQVDDFYNKREIELRSVYTETLMEVYNLLDMYIKNKDKFDVENDLQIKDQIERMKKQRESLHTYIAKLEICDIIVIEKKEKICH